MDETRPTPAACDRSTLKERRAAKSAAGGASIPLTVLPGHKAPPPRSRMGKWRAAALIGVHVLFIAHLVQWLTSDRVTGVRKTLSPVEPSEAMFTLENGTLNAGFVLFCAAIILTLIFGRFFCGWLCHVVALQDLCAWMMKKVGVHPKPWRTRLLLWAPTALALYMFVWPTFRRDVLLPLIARADPTAVSDIKDASGAVIGRAFTGDWAFVLGEVRPMQVLGVSNHFVIENLWATFAPWYVAVPFLLVCGFATVYFLGAKGFCTYGCPYGGFFSPVDRLAPMRIRVNDDCHQCGHCTAVCTSNVRVNEEVRDFGMVVDPGCMKCLDCVSACPNGALSVSWGRPAIFAPSRVDAAAMSASRQKKAARYDLSLREEIGLAALMFVLTIAYRGMYDGTVPLLMAMGLSSVATFMVYKTLRLAKDANVRGPFWQLKRTGSVTMPGWLFAGATSLLMLLAAQGLAVNAASLAGRYVAGGRVTVRDMQVLRDGQMPTDADRANARTALNYLRLAGSIGEGGINFTQTRLDMLYTRWMHVVLDEFEEAERLTRRLLEATGDDGEADRLGFILALRGRSGDQIIEELNRYVLQTPKLEGTREVIARFHLERQQLDKAIDVYRVAIGQWPRNPAIIVAAADFMLRVQQERIALEIARDGALRMPENYEVMMILGEALLRNNQPREANSAFLQAEKVDQTQPLPLLKQADILEAVGETDHAAKLRARADVLQTRLNEQAQRRFGVKPATPANPADSPASPPMQTPNP